MSTMIAGCPAAWAAFEIGDVERAADAVPGHQVVHPGEALEVVLVELAGLRLAQRG